MLWIILTDIANLMFPVRRIKNAKTAVERLETPGGCEPVALVMLLLVIALFSAEGCNAASPDAFYDIVVAGDFRVKVSVSCADIFDSVGIGTAYALKIISGCQLPGEQIRSDSFAGVKAFEKVEVIHQIRVDLHFVAEHSAGTSHTKGMSRSQDPAVFMDYPRKLIYTHASQFEYMEADVVRHYDDKMTCVLSVIFYAL